MVTRPANELAAHRPRLEPPASVQELRYVVENTDGADRARTLEGAIGRAGCAGGAHASCTTRTLRTSVDEDRTPRAELEGSLRSPNDPPTLQSEHVQAMGAVGPTAPTATKPWRRIGTGKTVHTTTTLPVSGLASALELPRPHRGSRPPLSRACPPLARKAWADTGRGEPFTVDTLVSPAAIAGATQRGARQNVTFALGVTGLWPAILSDRQRPVSPRPSARGRRRVSLGKMRFEHGSDRPSSRERGIPRVARRQSGL